MKKRVWPRGFTLIELALSMIFISILSITVVLLIQSTTASYRRGLILNEINTVGMDLVDEMRFSVQNSSSYSILEMCKTYYGEETDNRTNCIEDNASSFVTVTKRAMVKEKYGDGGTEEIIDTDMPVYGAFCTGTYTYIWNSGYFESITDPVIPIARSVTDNGVALEPVTLGVIDSSGLGTVTELNSGFRLLKIYDAERTICVNAMKAQDTSVEGGAYVPLSDYDNSRVQKQFIINETMLNQDSDAEGGVELMGKNDINDLVLYDLYIATPALSATRENFFYSAEFILGTRRGGINIKEAGNSCRPPSDDISELEYCAINKFNFAVEAGGR